jgi:hypothetical protein
MMRPVSFAGGRGRDGLCEHNGRDGCLLFLCLLDEPFEHEAGMGCVNTIAEMGGCSFLAS